MTKHAVDVTTEWLVREDTNITAMYGGKAVVVEAILGRSCRINDGNKEFVVLLELLTDVIADGQMLERRGYKAYQYKDFGARRRSDDHAVVDASSMNYDTDAEAREIAEFAEVQEFTEGSDNTMAGQLSQAGFGGFGPM